MGNQVTEKNVFIPSNGIRFRIRNFESKNYLYSNSDGRFGILKDCGVFSDQWWTLVKSDKSDVFKIRSAHSNKFLFGQSGGLLGVFDVDSNDQYWSLIPGVGKYRGFFKFKNHDNNKFAFANNAGAYGNYEDGDYPDHYWFFEYEDMKLVNIEYDLDSKKIVDSAPSVIASIVMPNYSSVEQSSTFEDTKIEEHTSNFEWNANIQMKVAYSKDFGVPKIAESKLSVELTTSAGKKWGEIDKSTQTYKFSVPVKCPPKTEITCIAKITHTKLRVPFIACLVSEETGTEVKMPGVWEGVSTYDFRIETTERKI